jgi:nucleoside-diphosphate-sugar epimerase
MKLLVSGATGFIGSTLISNFLKTKDNSVIALVRDTKNLNQLRNLTKSFGGDRLSIFDSSKVENVLTDQKFKPNHVVHLANKYIKSPSLQENEEMLHVNLSFGMKLANLANELNVGFIYASSYLEYQDIPDQSVSKYVAVKREFSNEIRKIKGLNVIENIIWDTYGRGDTRNKIVSSIVSHVKSGARISLDYPDNLISLTHARDVASALKQSFSGKNKTYLCASEMIITVGELQEAIMRLNKDNNLIIDYSNHEMDLYNLLKKTYEYPPNWKPQVSLRDGILEMLHD